MKHIAVIPARSGSKGLKDKNIKELKGKPLMVYAIEAAQKSGLYDIIHVSTWDAMRYVLKKYEALGMDFDTITVLQPTSPLRTEEDIIGAFELFEEKGANMISSVCEMEHSPLWSNTLPEDLSMAEFEDEKLAFLPRQSLPVYYRENGAVYIVKTSQLFAEVNIYKDKCYAYIMDKSHSVDIDEELDFIMAETIMGYDRRL